MRIAPVCRFLTVFVGLALTLFLQLACLTNPSGPPTQEPTTITLSTYRIVFTAVNDHVRIDATVLDQDSRVIADATVNWRSADNSVARVTDRGVVTAAGAGTTQITVSSGYATATATVSVEQAADSIEITPPSITLAQVGETGQFTAVVLDSNDRIIPGAAVVWSSSNPEIATVDASGLVTAVSPGDALVTASSGGVSTSRPVYVEVAPEPARIVLNISEATLAAVGQSLQLDAQVYDDNNAAIPGAAVMWSSSRPDVATVDAGGLVIAVSNGTTQVTASSGDASANALIHVVIEGTEPPEPPPPPPPPSASRIEINPSSATLTKVGQTVRLEAVVYDAEGTEIHGASVTWSSSRPEVATVNANGLVTAMSNGTARILAESGTISANVEIVVAISSSDREVLVQFYNATGGPTWNNNTNWLSDAPLNDWYGVSTDLIEGRVTHLDMNGNNLSGTLTPALGNLTELFMLSLPRNSISGRIPAELGRLTNLEWFNLASNKMTGSIPAELGNMNKLRAINLFNNQLTGNIPAELGQLTRLDYLDVASNLLTGNIPAELGNLTNLAVLGLQNNENMAGPLPVEITAISSLSYLNLEGTKLCVPDDSVFRTWLHIIEEKHGIQPCKAEPDELSDRDALTALYHATGGPNWTNDTNWLGEEPLGEWYGVSSDSEGRVIELRLDENNLTGFIPTEIGSLSELRRLSLIGNMLTGSIPREFGQLRNVEELSLSHNQLIGAIPPEIGKMSALLFFSAGDNQLRGEIPDEILQLSLLEHLNLSNNQLTGEIPSEIWQLRSLSNLSLGSNKFTGKIPPEIGNLTALQGLVLRFNDFSGGIPPEIGKLENLRSLLLTSTGLTGEIPAGIGALTKLVDLLLGDNHLTGGIPPEIGNLTALRTIWMHGNQLTGGIPPEIGNLTELESLSLYGNQLSGSVPPEIGKMTKLEWWNMNNNSNMSGPLPNEVTNITSLEYLYLDGTQICAPGNSMFDEWLDGLEDHRVVRCSSP